MTKMTLRTPLSLVAGLALAASLTACAGSGASSSSSGRTIAITITGNTVSPTPTTVSLRIGESLTLTVTSDHADKLHLHGFEIEKDLVAGQALSVTVTGAQPGVYDVETHHPELRLLKIAVQ